MNNWPFPVPDVYYIGVDVAIIGRDRTELWIMESDPVVEWLEALYELPSPH